MSDSEHDQSGYESGGVDSAFSHEELDAVPSTAEEYLVAILIGSSKPRRPRHFQGPGLVSGQIDGLEGLDLEVKTERIFTAMQGLAHRSKGVLTIAKKAEGDVTAYTQAVERVQKTGIDAQLLVINDDLDSRKRLFSGGTSTAGDVLMYKITGALAGQGYSLQDVFNLGKLVAANLASVSSFHYESTNLLADQISLMVARLAQPSPSLSINTNEPILLINAQAPINSSERVTFLNTIAASTIRALVRTTHIKTPVRIYAGCFLPERDPLDKDGTNENDEDNKRFSIVLLNVVNTNLGGPSMIQLLDYKPADAKAWSDAAGTKYAKEEWEALQQFLFDFAKDDSEMEFEDFEKKGILHFDFESYAGSVQTKSDSRMAGKDGSGSASLPAALQKVNFHPKTETSTGMATTEPIAGHADSTVPAQGKREDQVREEDEGFQII